MQVKWSSFSNTTKLGFSLKINLFFFSKKNEKTLNFFFKIGKRLQIRFKNCIAWYYFSKISFFYQNSGFLQKINIYKVWENCKFTEEFFSKKCFILRKGISISLQSRRVKNMPAVAGRFVSYEILVSRIQVLLTSVVL